MANMNLILELCPVQTSLHICSVTKVTNFHIFFAEFDYYFCTGVQSPAFYNSFVVSRPHFLLTASSVPNGFSEINPFHLKCMH